MPDIKISSHFLAGFAQCDRQCAKEKLNVRYIPLAFNASLHLAEYLKKNGKQHKSIYECIYVSSKIQQNERFPRFIIQGSIGAPTI